MGTGGGAWWPPWLHPSLPRPAQLSFLGTRSPRPQRPRPPAPQLPPHLRWCRPSPSGPSQTTRPHHSPLPLPVWDGGGTSEGCPSLRCLRVPAERLGRAGWPAIGPQSPGQQGGAGMAGAAECGGSPSACAACPHRRPGARCGQLPAPPQSRCADAEDRSRDGQAWRSLSEWRFNGTIAVTLWQWSPGRPGGPLGSPGRPRVAAYEQRQHHRPFPRPPLKRPKAAPR